MASKAAISTPRVVRLLRPVLASSTAARTAARVAGEEQVVRDAVGHQQGRYAGGVPDHFWRGGQGAQGLAELPQGEEHQQAEEGADRPPEQSRQEQPQSHGVDYGGADDQQRVGRLGMREEGVV
jgi:hypothetical protein